MKKALFWDFDGTIIYSNESFLDALCTAIEEYNYKIPRKQIKYALHVACSWYTPEIIYTEKTGQKWWDNLFEHFNLFYERNKIEKIDGDKINQLFKQQILDFNNYILYEDAKATLAQCIAMGYRNYVLSNNFPELSLIINDFGLSEYFSDYFVSSNIGYEKPRTEIFQYAFNAADFPKDCYMIGDNPIVDIQGGKAAGMKTILVHHGGSFEADLTCENLCKIPILLAK